MAQLHVADLEAAINYWRHKTSPPPAGDLGPELNALTTVYAQMVFDKTLSVDQCRVPDLAYQAWLNWYSTTLDTPCIAICSTSQGDSECKGCGRYFEEVQNWPVMTPLQKRSVWLRIIQESKALRFNRYSDRVRC
jgi:predicted Fe-S protein YdhL (DUF1289 family)